MFFSYGHISQIFITITIFQGVIMNKSNTIQSEQEAFIYCKRLPPTDGTTGVQWVERLEGKGVRLAPHVVKLLNSQEFVPTTGVIYEVALFRGNFWENDFHRTVKNALIEGKLRGLDEINIEATCLSLENLFLNDMLGCMWIIVMQKPFEGYSLFCYAIDDSKFFKQHQKTNFEKYTALNANLSFSKLKKNDGFLFLKNKNP